MEEAVTLQVELQQLFSRGGFLLRKWSSSEQAVVAGIPLELRDAHSLQAIPDPEGFTKTLGLEWNAHADHFRLTISELPELEVVTK